MSDKTNIVQTIKLSQFTHALIESYTLTKPKGRPDDISKLTVSQTVSFFFILYEKVRNAVEYREDHLIRKAAIERIIKRRFSINPSGKNEAENLLRELLWARYFDDGSLGGDDVNQIQEIIDKYLKLKQLITAGRPVEEKSYLYQFIIDLLTCEIEENLNPEGSTREASFTFFVYQVLRRKIKIEGVSYYKKDAFFLAAIEKAYRRSDRSYQRFHLFITFYNKIQRYSDNELIALSSKLPEIFNKIDQMLNNQFVDKLVRFTKKHLPPFLTLFDIIKSKKPPNNQLTVITDKTSLWNVVDQTCRDKYQSIGLRLRNLAIKSFIYIFLTKMLFALILEYPVSKLIDGEVNNSSILINSLFPPFLMLLILAFFRLPGEDNTRKIYSRIIEIIDASKSFETRVAFMPKATPSKRPILIFGFTIFYSLTFIITLLIIYELLLYLNFNLVSQVVFIFFLSIITFFSYRIKQIVNEYRLEEKESIFSPIIDFFFMPVLSLGKFFSSELAKLNFFIVIFDFIIEAPFKFLFEIIEEWISFVKKRKEEII